MLFWLRSKDGTYVGTLYLIVYEMRLFLQELLQYILLVVKPFLSDAKKVKLLY